MESFLVSSGGMHVRFPPELWQQCGASLRMDQGICGFPSRLSQEAFPRSFPTRLSHVSPWCESILGLKVEAVQGKQVPWNGLRHLGDSGNGGTTLEFLSPFLWRAPPLEMRRKRQEFFPEHEGKDPFIDLAGGNGAPLDVGGTLVLPLEWRRVCRGTF